MQVKSQPHLQSTSLFNQANKVLAGGVNSPVRAFNAVGGAPIFFQRGTGPYLFDVDDNQYVDYVGSWGPMILGHANPAVIQAVTTVAQNSLSFGAPCALETRLAEVIQENMPSMEKMRFVSSGTEATMSAIRLARAATGRDKIIKFAGCYHGHADAFLVQAGSGAATGGQPNSPGIPAVVAAQTEIAEYNDIASVERIFASNSGNIAAIIVEPIAGNMNMILPQTGFLGTLRRLADQYGALLIFDEVMTGFRVAAGGAQALYQIKPDLTTLGKIIGGGLPVGAFGGRQELMALLAPEGAVYQAGTLSGNPVAMAAGLSTLQQLNANSYQQLSERSQQLTQGLEQAAQAAGIGLQTCHQGGMFGFSFCDHTDAPSNFSSAQACNTTRFTAFFHAMLQQGHYFAPSAFEAGFISLSHTANDIESTLTAARSAFQKLTK